MKYLLDTHILLWLRLDPDKLTPEQKTAIDSSQDEKYLSTLSIWEVSLKFSLGKLELGTHTPDEFLAGISRLGLGTISPTPEQYATYYRLPTIENHRDPFDRMLIWQALQSGMTLLSSDRKLSEYKPYGLLVT